MTKFKAVLILTVALMAGQNAYAAAIYTDFTDFQNAVNALNTITFEENASGDFTFYGTGPATFGPFDFFGTDSVFTVDPDFDPSFYEWGSGDVLIDAFGDGTLSAVHTGITALGADIMSVDPEGADFEIILSTGDVFVLSTAVRPTRTFVGFTSDIPITSVSFQTLDGNIPIIDNFVYGDAIREPGPTVIPEPGTFVLMGLGLAVSFAVRRLRRS